jgi:hypothetical protein
MRLMHLVYLEDEFDHKIGLRLPRIGVKVQHFIFALETVLCVYFSIKTFNIWQGPPRITHWSVLLVETKEDRLRYFTGRLRTS